MYTAAALATLSLLAGVRAQNVGTQVPEVHLSMTTQTCTASGCTNEADKVVIDANWRWLHTTTGYTNCYTGNTFDPTLCPDSATCTKNCALDGAVYGSTYGITTPTATSLRLNFVTTGTGKNIGSRTYLMNTDTSYKMFKLLNQEFTFDVDMSNLPCGLNGALYFVAMDADGGMSKYPTNKAGAKYGTGYCDAQCPQDLKFIDGMANSAGWAANPADVNAGTGSHGSCCPEMDIWEANMNAAAFTPHPCSVLSQTQCDAGTTCARNTGLCDGDGCDFNSYRMGNTTFLGVGMTIDTSKPFTIVTQFHTTDGTASGDLSEIKRYYVQNGVTYANSQPDVAGVNGNSITDAWCAAQKTAFGDTNVFASKGGLVQMGDAMKRGMVLVMSVWDDHAVDMLWLDSAYPTDLPATNPGVARGPCDATSGAPATVEAAHPNAYVIYSNVKIGPFGSTFNAKNIVGNDADFVAGASAPVAAPAPVAPNPVSPAPVVPAPVAPVPVAPAPASGAIAQYGQCGGEGYSGATTCAAGYTCTMANQYFSQCL